MIINQGIYMKNIHEVKLYLDSIYSELSSLIAKDYKLSPAELSVEECKRMESRLGVDLPSDYQDAILSYEWSNIRFGNIKFHSIPDEIDRIHSSQLNPMIEIYSKMKLLEIGRYETDNILLNCDKESDYFGTILYIDHDRYPNLDPEPIAVNFQSLVICGVYDFKMKFESGLFSHPESLSDRLEDELFKKILDDIVSFDETAGKTSFWKKFIWGF